MRKTVFQGKYSATVLKNSYNWLDHFPQFYSSIIEIEKNTPDLFHDAFYTSLDFGTGGLRGLMGLGSNRLNEINIRLATLGVGKYILKQPFFNKKDHHKVIIGYDTRINSKSFAEEAAKTLASLGIKVLLYNGPRPVPLVSFGVLYNSCTAGIMITASHNPKEYNGYKVFWKHGGQVVSPQDKEIIDSVNQIPFSEAAKESLPLEEIVSLGEEVENAYVESISKILYRKDFNIEKGGELEIIYSNLHGTGLSLVPKILIKSGFSNFITVPEQEVTDGNFPTVKLPNPEDPEALEIGVNLLKKTKRDIFFATDPDADRIGVVILDENEPYYFSGNQIACILFDYICSSLSKKTCLNSSYKAVKSLATTDMFYSIGKHYGCSVQDVLTGFKYIGEQIKEWEENKENIFIFGAEESYGYLCSSYIKDKDALGTMAIISEIALLNKMNKKTLRDVLDELYVKYGFYVDKTLSLTFYGEEGQEKIKVLINKLREKMHSECYSGGIFFNDVRDYQNSIYINSITREKKDLSFPKSNVLRFFSDAHKCRIILRPSGTEPKLKLYFELANSEDKVFSKKECRKKLEEMRKSLDEIISNVCQEWEIVRI